MRPIDAREWKSFYTDMADSRNMIDLYDIGYMNALDDVDDWMGAQPTLTYEDLVPHGRWGKVIPSKSAAKWSSKVSCSVCHKAGYERYNYCPNCGAKMDGGQDNA